MKFDFAQDRVLAVVAHPDDAELLCAGTLARAKRDGAAIGVCVLCRGDKGQPAEGAIADLVEVRRREMQASAKLLGAELFTGEAEDSRLADTYELQGWLRDVARRFRPTLLLGHFPGDYHVDHRAASAVTEAVSWNCASPGQPSEEPPLERPTALWWMDTVTMQGFEPEIFVDVSDHAELKHELLACHQSQLARAGDSAFTSLDGLMRQQYTARGMQADVAAAEAFRVYRSFKRTRAW
ncbi:MAG: PIG-L family deacetylase [Planctomycetota bacterium]|nr:MAG: PIG-L family deacetylase [Planctomycetota bacterium]REJ93132.1 MAG: PIG-L family deacetylase [Planctomycetota bacterium]REK30121.1 MAG: PIG-L family deacetylase [Planctomycetota bacterium]REK37636.1 MAG: PIG-L family deacetylase [Planctomycetota bacterium]